MGRAALFLATGFLIIFGMIQNSVQNRQQVLAERSPEYYYEEQSRNIAFATMEVALKQLNNYADDSKTYSRTDPCDIIRDSAVEIMGETGSIDCYQSSQNFNTTVFLEIAGHSGSDDSKITTKIEAIANRPAFSIYAYFTDEEKTPSGNNIYFTSGDILNGPVHTNGKFRIQGDPIFNGPISSHDGKYESSGSNPTFNGPTNFSAKKIKLPEEAIEAKQLADDKKNGGIGQFNNSIFVEFKEGDSSKNNDGVVEISKPVWRCVAYCWDEDRAIYNESPDPSTTRTHKISEFNGVISTKNNLYVKGKVDGEVTINAENDIKIMGDIEYENRNYNDKSQPISDDRLGIISRDDVIVDNYAQYDNGYKDINIDATITTLKGSFRVQDYAANYSRGTINLLGGLIQRTRGPVGQTNGDGYSKNYTYDTRFATNSTPGFPKIRRFEIEGWREITTESSNF